MEKIIMGSVGAAGKIQVSDGAGGFDDGISALETPVNGASVTGKMQVASLITGAGCSGTDVVFIGSNASYIPGGHSAFFGQFTTCGGVGTGAGSAAVGAENSRVTKNHVSLLGTSAIGDAEGCVVIGRGAICPIYTDHSIAIGNTATVSSGRDIAIGNSANTTCNGGDAIAIGSTATVGQGRAIAIGAGANIPLNCGNSVAIGYQATVTATNQFVAGGPTITDFYAGPISAPVKGHFSDIVLGAVRLTVMAGTNPGTSKVVVYGPTSGPLTIMDNIV